MQPMNVGDYRELARRRLPRGVFEYIDRGTEDEIALGDLRQSLDRIKFSPKVCVDVREIDLSSEVLGRSLRLPIIVAPTALAGLLWHEGELELAKSAHSAGMPFCVSTMSLSSIEDIYIGAPEADLWFQLYVWRNRQLTLALLDRVKRAGVQTLVVTVDTPASPKKEWNDRNGFGLPMVPSLRACVDLASHPRWLWSVLIRGLLVKGLPAYAHYPAELGIDVSMQSTDDLRLSDRLSWEEIRDLRRQWPGKFVIKGILRVDDAEKAYQCGADGIVVSSHGGRNLDSSISPISALPHIADSLDHRLTIIADSGIRRGSDIAKYLANGASAVMVGRAFLYGVAARGGHGAQEIVEILKDELTRTLAFVGEPCIRNLSRQHLAKNSHQ